MDILSDYDRRRQESLQQAEADLDGPELYAEVFSFDPAYVSKKPDLEISLTEKLRLCLLFGPQHLQFVVCDTDDQIHDAGQCSCDTTSAELSRLLQLHAIDDAAQLLRRHPDAFFLREQQLPGAVNIAQAAFCALDADETKQLLHQLPAQFCLALYAQKSSWINSTVFCNAPQLFSAPSQHALLQSMAAYPETVAQFSNRAAHLLDFCEAVLRPPFQEDSLKDANKPDGLAEWSTGLLENLAYVSADTCAPACRVALTEAFVELLRKHATVPAFVACIQPLEKFPEMSTDLLEATVAGLLEKPLTPSVAFNAYVADISVLLQRQEARQHIFSLLALPELFPVAKTAISGLSTLVRNLQHAACFRERFTAEKAPAGSRSR